MTRYFTPTCLTSSLVSVGIASWLIITATNQHPNRSFDWARRYDPAVMLIPNWRFFAPNPAVHDFRLAHRILWSDNQESEWMDTRDIPKRKWWNPIWFPSRRIDKGITDLSNGLLEIITTPGINIEETPQYAMLCSLSRRSIEEMLNDNFSGKNSETPTGFQFALGRDPGRDTEEKPALIFISRFELWSNA